MPLEHGTLWTRSGGLMASSDTVRITVRGKQTHGAAPWDGVDPIVVSAQIITALQTIVSRQIDLTAAPAVVSIGRINGGVRFNIIPDSVSLEGTIRALDSSRPARSARAGETNRGINRSERRRDRRSVVRNRHRADHLQRSRP